MAAPPDAYTEPTQVPPVLASGQYLTNADLITAVLARGEAIGMCNADKAAVRAFYNKKE